ncbi:unnamed protein product, partial [Gulo gulo]
HATCWEQLTVTAVLWTLLGLPGDLPCFSSDPPPHALYGPEGTQTKTRTNPSGSPLAPNRPASLYLSFLLLIDFLLGDT